jgi:hypothetical protein
MQGGGTLVSCKTVVKSVGTISGRYIWLKYAGR